MTCFVKWNLIGEETEAESPFPHDSPTTAFKYSDTVVEVLTAMMVKDPVSLVWVEDENGERIERPRKRLILNADFRCFYRFHKQSGR